MGATLEKGGNLKCSNYLCDSIETGVSWHDVSCFKYKFISDFQDSIFLYQANGRYNISNTTNFMTKYPESVCRHKGRVDDRQSLFPLKPLQE